jgi:hypothetical protein
VNPDSLNPDPDLAFKVNPDPGTPLNLDTHTEKNVAHCIIIRTG